MLLFFALELLLQPNQLFVSIFVVHFQGPESFLKAGCLPFGQGQMGVIIMPAEIKQLGPEFLKPPHDGLFGVVELLLQSCSTVLDFLPNLLRFLLDFCYFVLTDPNFVLDYRGVGSEALCVLNLEALFGDVREMLAEACIGGRGDAVRV